METRVWRRRSDGRAIPTSASIFVSPGGADIASCSSAYPQGVLTPQVPQGLFRIPEVSKTSTSIKETRFNSGVWHLRHSSRAEGSLGLPEGGGN